MAPDFEGYRAAVNDVIQKDIATLTKEKEAKEREIATLERRIAKLRSGIQEDQTGIETASANLATVASLPAIDIFVPSQPDGAVSFEDFTSAVDMQVEAASADERERYLQKAHTLTDARVKLQSAGIDHERRIVVEPQEPFRRFVSEHIHRGEPDPAGNVAIRFIDTEVTLTKEEAALLDLLINNEGIPMPRQTIAELLNISYSKVNDRIQRLNKKLSSRTSGPIRNNNPGMKYQKHGTYLSLFSMKYQLEESLEPRPKYEEISLEYLELEFNLDDLTDE